MRIVTLEDGINTPIASYNDGDIFVSTNFTEIKRYTEPLKVAMSVIAFCTHGDGTVTLNDNAYNFAAEDMVFISTDSIIDSTTSTEDAQFRILAFNKSSLANNIVLVKDIWTSQTFIKSNPICHLSEYQYNVMLHYFDLAYLYSQNTNDMYKKEKMNNLIRCWIYDLLTIVSQHSDSKEITEKMFSSKDILLQRFLETLALHNGKMRSVQTAAQQMCISPKYLSSVIKEASGKTPQSIIHEFTINAIKEQLKYSGKSIKEISNEMEFPEPSFFGKFFKQQTGMTPIEYRRQVLNKQNGQDKDSSKQNKKALNSFEYTGDKDLDKEISSFFSAVTFMGLM